MHISGTMNAVESGDYIRPPTDAEGYLATARAMLDGARPLVLTTPIPAIALSLLCGYAAEAALKASLAQAGVSTKELGSRALGHELIRLWLRAVAEGVALQASPPQWIEHLNRVHSAPYHLRYPLGFHAIVLPNQAAMLQGCEELCSMAISCIK